jgi:hypothetical protein
LGTPTKPLMKGYSWVLAYLTVALLDAEFWKLNSSKIWIRFFLYYIR